MKYSVLFWLLEEVLTIRTLTTSRIASSRNNHHLRSPNTARRSAQQHHSFETPRHWSTRHTPTYTIAKNSIQVVQSSGAGTEHHSTWRQHRCGGREIPSGHNHKGHSRIGANEGSQPLVESLPPSEHPDSQDECQQELWVPAIKHTRSVSLKKMKGERLM